MEKDLSKEQTSIMSNVPLGGFRYKWKRAFLNIKISTANLAKIHDQS